MSGTIFFVLTLFALLFSGVLVEYGLSVPSVVNSLQGPISCDVNNIPTTTCSFPVWNPPPLTGVNNTSTATGKPSIPWWQCVLYIQVCIASSTSTVTNAATSAGTAIWNGLQLIAYSIGWFAVATVVFFNKTLQGILLIYGITQIFTFTDFRIPLLSYFFIAFVIFYIMYGISMLKPGGSGLPG